MDAVVDVEVAEELLVERITGRMSCGNCLEVYHRTFNPPAVEGKCDKCGSNDFKVRADDTKEVVVSRLEAYHAQTAPLRDYYKAQSLLRSVDGVGDVDQVQARIFAVLGD